MRGHSRCGSVYVVVGVALCTVCDSGCGRGCRSSILEIEAGSTRAVVCDGASSSGSDGTVYSHYRLPRRTQGIGPTCSSGLPMLAVLLLCVSPLCTGPETLITDSMDATNSIQVLVELVQEL